MVNMSTVPISGEILTLGTSTVPISGEILALGTSTVPLSGEILALGTSTLPISGEILAFSTSAWYSLPGTMVPGKYPMVSWRCKKVKRKLTGDKANDIYGVMKIHEYS